MNHTLLYKYKSLLLLLALLCSMGARGADGDTFSYTSSGVAIVYKVISESQRTCQVGRGTGLCIPSGMAGLVKIPAYTDKYEVTRIGQYAFTGAKITGVEIPSTVTSIEFFAFDNCPNISSIALPSSVRTLGERAFQYCTNLQSMTIPASVSSIGVGVLRGCSNLTSITVDANNTKYDSRNDCNAIIETATNTLIQGCTNTVIPEGVTSIREWAMAINGATAISIPSSVTTIGEYAFYKCEKLQDLYCYALTPPTAHSDAFYNSTQATLHVPASALSAYQSTAPWSSFANIVAIEEEPVPADGDCYVEYFIGSDPGMGQGTKVQADAEGNVDFELPMDELKEGLNLVGLRAVCKNEDGSYTYGTTTTKYVYKYRAQNGEVAGAEWFLNSDPGVGSANRVLADASGNVNFDLPVSEMREGLNVLGLRAIGRDGQQETFGSTQWQFVYRTAAAAQVPVDLVEYFWDEDPGQGQGTRVTITPQAEVTLTDLEVSIEGLTPGVHTLYLRARASEAWSQLQQQEVTIEENTPDPIDEQVVNPNDLVQLKNLYEATGGDDWYVQWDIDNNGRSFDDFPGVTFNEDGRVTKIDLTENNLTGNLTYALPLYLPYLTELNLSRNQLTGDLNYEFLMDADDMELKRLDVSFNGLIEVSNPLPATITYLNLDHQNYVYDEWGDMVSDEMIQNILFGQMFGGDPMLAYVSQKEQLGIPTIFTYNHARRDYSLTPTLQIFQMDDMYNDLPDIFGHLAYNESKEAYNYVHTSAGDYDFDQDEPVILTCDRGCYPSVLRYVKGDADMSGITDVLDVQRTLNYALITEKARSKSGEQYSDFNRSAANTYEDDVINVQDIVCTVNIVLESDWLTENNGEWDPGDADDWVPEMARRRVAEGYASFVAQQGNIVLSNTTDVAAMAIELKGVKTDEVALLLPRGQWQMRSCNVVGGSRYVIFSPTGQTLPAGTTALLQMVGDGEPTAAQCANADAQSVRVLLGSEVTGVEGVAIASQQATQVYDLQGRKVAGKQRKGVYIVDGQKKVVK